MDEEDLAEAAEAQQLRTAEAFTGVGQESHSRTSRRGLVGLLRGKNDTMGAVLLGKMGWKEGQGVGPKVRRKVCLGLDGSSNDILPRGVSDTYLFSPKDISPVSSYRKPDRSGVGHGIHILSPSSHPPLRRGHNVNRIEDENLFSPTAFVQKAQGDAPFARGGIGTGIPDDSDSEHEDIGPRLVFSGRNRGKRVPKKYPLKGQALHHVHINTNSKSIKVAGHDRLSPLTGFIFRPSKYSDTNYPYAPFHYPQPLIIPKSWDATRWAVAQPCSARSRPSADAPFSTPRDSNARAQMLGESRLPGRSVFDYMTATTRDRLVAITKNRDLPAAGEVLPRTQANHVLRERSPPAKSWAPHLSQEVARAALARDRMGSGPYMANPGKRARYHQFLSYSCGLLAEMPSRPEDMSQVDFAQELEEFAKCAEIFKPMVGPIASRFTTSSVSAPMPASQSTNPSQGTEVDLQDTAFDAAKLGMFGIATRSRALFTPQQLLCKRFNVKPPTQAKGNTQESRAQEPRLDAMIAVKPSSAPSASQSMADAPGSTKDSIVFRPPTQVFTAIFGDSSDEDAAIV